MTARALAPRRSNSFGPSALLIEARAAASIAQNARYSRRLSIGRLGRLLRLPAAIGFAFFAASLSAQTLPEDECAKLKDPEAEIVCLRAALAATRQAQSAVPDRAPVETSPARPASVPPPVVDAAPPEQAAPVVAAGLGSEQVARPEGAPKPARDPEVLVERVADFRADRTGALIMQLENGQIWRQVENIDLPLRLDEGERAEVQITRSGFGGYRMHFPAMNRTISVSRIR